MVIGIVGKGGSGKTTLGAAIMYKDYLRQNRAYKIKSKFLRNLYSRFFPYHDYRFCTDDSVQFCDHFSYDSFGKWNVPDNSLIWLEECGLGFNNRRWKEMTPEAQSMIAKIRHHKSDIYWTNQADDIDCFLLRRTHQVYLLSKSFGDFSYKEPIAYDLDVVNGDICSTYTKSYGFARIKDFITGRARFFNRRPYYAFFDSFEDSTEYELPIPNDLIPNIEIKK